MSESEMEKNRLRYSKLVEWAFWRYREDESDEFGNPCIVIDVGGNPSKYSRIEAMAWNRYVENKGK